MRDFDGAMKELVKAAAPELFAQMGVAGRLVGWRNLELPASKRQADLLAELDTGDLLHCELQAKNDRKMDLRMLEYCVRILEQTGVVPHQFVLYFGQEKVRMPDTLEGPGIRFRYTLIDVRALDERALLASGRAEANILAVLTERGTPEDVIRRLRLRLFSTNRDDRLRLEDLFLLLCSLRGLDGRKVLTMPLDAMDIPLVREYWESGLAEGKAEGMAQGRTELLLYMAADRFGPLPEWARARVAGAPTEQILKWSTALFHAASLEDLFGRE